MPKGRLGASIARRWTDSAKPGKADKPGKAPIKPIKAGKATNKHGKTNSKASKSISTSNSVDQNDQNGNVLEQIKSDPLFVTALCVMNNVTASDVCHALNFICQKTSCRLQHPTFDTVCRICPNKVYSTTKRVESGPRRGDFVLLYECGSANTRYDQARNAIVCSDCGGSFTGMGTQTVYTDNKLSDLFTKSKPTLEHIVQRYNERGDGRQLPQHVIHDTLVLKDSINPEALQCQNKRDHLLLASLMYVAYDLQSRSDNALTFGARMQYAASLPAHIPRCDKRAFAFADNDNCYSFDNDVQYDTWTARWMRVHFICDTCKQRYPTRRDQMRCDYCRKSRYANKFALMSTPETTIMGDMQCLFPPKTTLRKVDFYKIITRNQVMKVNEEHLRVETATGVHRRAHVGFTAALHRVIDKLTRLQAEIKDQRAEKRKPQWPLRQGRWWPHDLTWDQLTDLGCEDLQLDGAGPKMYVRIMCNVPNL